MKKIIMCLLSLSILTSCQKSVETSAHLPVLTLTNERIQIPVDSAFTYLSYISSATDINDGDLLQQVSYNTIDTHTLGSKDVVYKVKNSQNQIVRKVLKVDIVKYYNEFFDPTSVDADTISNPDNILTIVNKTNALSQSYIPDDLESVIDNKEQYLRKEANDAYTELYNAAKKEGIELYTVSAYRSYEKQNYLWNEAVKQHGIAHASQYNAYPGRSEHQLGLAIDISNSLKNPLTDKIADTKIGNFLETRAYKYGFVLRYPRNKTYITNYAYEPWHIRYVGKDVAYTLYKQQITLEEYN